MVKSKISDYIIGIIIFSLFITAGVSILGIYRSNSATFGGSQYTQYNSSLNKLNQIHDTVGVYSDDLNTSGTTGFGTLGILNDLITKGWNTLRLVGSSFSFMGGVYSSSAEMFGIPTFVVTIITLIFSVILIFTIWSAIFQRDL